MEENIIKEKIERSIEIVCILYEKELITDAYIIGSLAKGIPNKDSDIDLILVNPKFEIATISLSPHYDVGNVGRVVDLLKNTGLEFKSIKREKKEHKEEIWYQLYKHELFHISVVLMSLDIEKIESIRITKDFCDQK